MIFLSVLTDTANTSFSRTYVKTAYEKGDTNLDGQIIFQGADNDLSPVFINVLTFPANGSFSRSFTISAQLPD
ncbi:MAG: hypothetical protein AAFQ87_26090 [Bacteroidota bacterium]